MPRTTSRPVSARVLFLAAVTSAAVVLLGADAADAQAQVQCSRRNPAACFQAFWPVPTTVPATPPTTVAPAPAVPPVVAPVAPVLTPPPATTPVTVPDAARQLIDLVNGERTRAGLGVVTNRDDIGRIALDHSFRMAAAGNIFHNDDYFSTTVKNLIGSLARGENVAQNTSVEDAHRRLMNSPGHRANILDGRFNTVGFAVVRTSNGQYWITQDFAQTRGGAAPAAAPVAPSPPATTPRAVAARPVATTTPPAPAPALVVPVSVDLASETLSMADAAPEPPVVLSSGPSLAERAGSGGMGTGIGILAVFGLAGLALGSWQLRRKTAHLWA